MTDAATGFPPLAAPDAVVLVLGTLPSRASLEMKQYYAHPRNAFWRIMGEFFDAGPELPYRERVDRLLSHRVAVWDVLQSSLRPGSLDAAIDLATARANDFADFFASHAEVRLVCFNGLKAADLFARLVSAGPAATRPGLRFLTCPSTSPAHAALSFEDKLERWLPVRDESYNP